jgi:PAS domain S-box-containing protein
MFRNKIKSNAIIANYAMSLIEAIRDPLFAISPEGKITDMNKASIDKTDVTREKMVGTDFFDYFTSPNKARAICIEIFTNGFIEDYPLVMKDGHLTDVLLNGSVYKDSTGKVVGAVIVARDITQQKRIEKEFTEAKVFAELTTVIAEEAKSKAETAAIAAEEAVKTKQQFLSNMSHEIRTPMNAIIGFTKVLLKTELTSKQKEYLTAIKLSGDALIVLINDILDLAKIEAGKMQFEQTPFKMEASLSTMIQLFEQKIQEKNIVLVKEYDDRIPHTIIGDPIRLHQIIINLLSNALKFTTNGQITIRIILLKEDAENVWIEFSVADTGIGIAESKMGKIFENFQQASSTTSRLYGGTGLGLAIVKQLVETQGGSIGVESKIGEGSLFRFTLSFKKTAVLPNVEVSNRVSDPQIKNLKVLAVEDIALNQLLMKTLLDDFGFERDIAANGKIAIEKMQEHHYDIVLMDLQMPEMNGFEATDYIRNTLKSNIPIIALTADVTTVDLAKCMAVGMNDYIAKPVDEVLLYNKIIQLVKQAGHIGQIHHQSASRYRKPLEKCINLDYLSERTKSDPNLMMEMITLYLEQTPDLIIAMKLSLEQEDWIALHAAVHKMIPSFAIMGMSSHFEGMAKQVKEYASSQQEKENIPGLVLQLEHICTQACIELTEELDSIKNKIA